VSSFIKAVETLGRPGYSESGAGCLRFKTLYHKFILNHTKESTFFKESANLRLFHVSYTWPVGLILNVHVRLRGKATCGVEGAVQTMVTYYRITGISISFDF